MQNVSIKGFIYAALSSATFGLAPFFTISLLLAGFSSFEVLAYRWGIASLTLVVFGIMLGETFRISRKDWGTVFILSLLRAATSFSLVIAYQNISSGVASTIHFMYPLAVALAMALFFRERISWRTAAAIGVSLAGVALLSTGGIGSRGGGVGIGCRGRSLDNRLGRGGGCLGQHIIQHFGDRAPGLPGSADRTAGIAEAAAQCRDRCGNSGGLRCGGHSCGGGRTQRHSVCGHLCSKISRRKDHRIALHTACHIQLRQLDRDRLRARPPTGMRGVSIWAPAGQASAGSQTR